MSTNTTLKLILAFVFIQLYIPNINAQNFATISGVVRDIDTKKPVDFANIRLAETTTGTQTDEEGRYSIKVKVGVPVRLIFTRIGYKEYSSSFQFTNTTAQVFSVDMVPIESSLEVEIKENRVQSNGMIRQSTEELRLLPSASGNLESLLPSIALGTSSGTGGELSAQYNVRGGNYDENLIYINDFEIFRPQLIRTSQQEGLTFPNIDLIRDLSFSSGGFQAKYGDKLSSVLDISYKRPERTAASVYASLLGASAHLEGAKSLNKDSYRKFRYLMGARYKTSRYLLNTLDVTGEYLPVFADFQGFFTYDLSRTVQVGLIANYNNSDYFFIPDQRTTASGLVNFTLQLSADYEGQEVNRFTQMMGGLSFTWLPEKKKDPIFMKLLLAVHKGYEDETFDLLAYYSLAQIETNPNAENAGEVVAVLGEGIQHNYARNYLRTGIKVADFRGGYERNREGKPAQFIEWSVKAQAENISDRLNEWERIDSAGYSLPYQPTQLLLQSVYKSKNELNSLRMTAMAQHTLTWTKKDASILELNYGLRAATWTLNKETFVTPRAMLSYTPLAWTQKTQFRLSGGLYYQPAFYREMRNISGVVNTDLRAQKSGQIVLGMSREFYMKSISTKPFLFVSELYYKRLWDVVSYEVDNVRIRYSGQNDATGYVTGWDFRINGEFVPNAESWINVSLLRAREQLNGVQHKEREQGKEEGQDVNFVPRPTDQLVTVNIFFQDYLPRRENFKVHLNLAFGSGLPFGLKDANKIYRNPYRFNAYHRADIGFSYQVWDSKWKDKKPGNIFRWTKSTWISFEVFNLLDVSNVASNTWIKTVFARQYAIPNYLTSRRLNLRMGVNF